MPGLLDYLDSLDRDLARAGSAACEQACDCHRHTANARLTVASMRTVIERGRDTGEFLPVTSLCSLCGRSDCPGLCS